MDALNNPTPTPNAEPTDTKDNGHAANGLHPAETPAAGRKISGEEALDRIFEKNAELYRRLA